MTSFFWGGPGSHFLRLLAREESTQIRAMTSVIESQVRKGDQGATGCSQEPPVVSSCIVARCNLCLVDGFSLCFCLVNETCCVFGLPRTIVTYFSWYFCSKISPEIQVITAAGEANYTLITKTAKVDLPWQVTLESETDRKRWTYPPS